MKYVRIGEGEGRMRGGTTETLLTNQKAEVKVFSCHIWVTLNRVTLTARCSERPFFKFCSV